MSLHWNKRIYLGMNKSKKWSVVGPECDWSKKAFQAEKSMTKDTIVKQQGIFKKENIAIAQRTMEGF